jgi:hypothetical protein
MINNTLKNHYKNSVADKKRTIKSIPIKSLSKKVYERVLICFRVKKKRII